MTKKRFCVLKYKAKDQSFGFMVFLGVESCHESQTSGFDHVQGNHPGSFGAHPCAGSLLSLRALAVVGMFVFVEECHKKSQMFAIQSEDFCVFFQPFSREAVFLGEVPPVLFTSWLTCMAGSISRWTDTIHRGGSEAPFSEQWICVLPSWEGR